MTRRPLIIDIRQDSRSKAVENAVTDNPADTAPVQQGDDGKDILQLENRIDDVEYSDEDTVENSNEYEDAPVPLVSRDWVIGTLFGILALIWAGFMGWNTATALGGRVPTTTEIANFIGILSAPLALLGICYLLLMRTSRREARHFMRTASAIRTESQWLETVLKNVTNRISENRVLLTDQAHQLMSVSEEATNRMKSASDVLQNEVDAVGRQNNALKNAATAARADMTILLAELPKAQVQALHMTEYLKTAGITAAEQAEILGTQLSSLSTRGREADEIAGGAARRLAEHLTQMETTSETAGVRIETASSQMNDVVDAALNRVAESVDSARKGMEAHGAAMLAMIAQSQAALGRTGEDASATLNARIEDINNKIGHLGQSLASHEAITREMIGLIQNGLGDVEQRLVTLDVEGTEQANRLGLALGGLRTHSEDMGRAMKDSGVVVDALIGKSEGLLTALDANARELEETLPNALDRFHVQIKQSHGLLSTIIPDAEKLEMTTVSAHNRIAEVETALNRQRDGIDMLITNMDARIAENHSAVDALAQAIGKASDEANIFANTSSPQLLETLVRVRDTATQASERAKETLANIVSDTSTALGAASETAIREAITAKIDAQMLEIAASAERAVAATQQANEQLMRQMLSIADTTVSIENRIQEARADTENADRDNFSKRVALLIESLNSTSIDVAKLLSNDVTDTAWAAYLKGDRGIFTRRAVRLLDSGETREIVRHYGEDPEFREQVNRYIHDFESMLRNILATRDGSPLGVTLLSSDMGKLYVALAQSIERLRS